MKKEKRGSELYGSRNYLLLTVGLVLIVAGYICLGWKPKDGTLTMNVAPILLVIGYCVVVPIALFIKPEKESKKEAIQDKK